MLAMTIISERIGHWTKIRRSIAPLSGSDLSIRTRSWADFTITTFASRFSVHTGRGWAHELKHDGYRLQIHVRDGRVKLYTRHVLEVMPVVAGGDTRSERRSE